MATHLRIGRSLPTVRKGKSQGDFMNSRKRKKGRKKRERERGGRREERGKGGREYILLLTLLERCFF